LTDEQRRRGGKDRQPFGPAAGPSGHQLRNSCVLRPEHWQKNFKFPKMSIFQCLRNSMKKKPTPKNSDWNISFWFAVLSPLIGVAIGFVAAAIVETL
jgi:hypothetical protein